MSTKKTHISTKAELEQKRKSAPATPDLEKWVESRATGAEPEQMKRLTIDVPVSLHRAIKSQCAMRGTKIADEVRELLTQKYGNQ